MTREEEQKIIDVLGISTPIMTMTQKEFNDYIYTQIIDRLKQESNTWSLDDAREDFIHNVYSTLDFLPTNDEANRIIDSFDRITSNIKQEPILDKIRAEIDLDTRIQVKHYTNTDAVIDTVLEIIDKYKAGSEE